MHTPRYFTSWLENQITFIKEKIFEIIDVMMYKHSLTKSFLYPLIFPWRIEKCLPRLVILMTLWWWHFLAMLGTTQKVSRIARYLGCVGKVRPPQSLQALKTKVVAARQARRRPFAAAISGADTPKFRKQSYTFFATWKSKGAIPLSYNFRYFASRLMLRWIWLMKSIQAGAFFQK